MLSFPSLLFLQRIQDNLIIMSDTRRGQSKPTLGDLLVETSKGEWFNARRKSLFRVLLCDFSRTRQQLLHERRLVLTRSLLQSACLCLVLIVDFGSVELEIACHVDSPGNSTVDVKLGAEFLGLNTVNQCQPFDVSYGL